MPQENSTTLPGKAQRPQSAFNHTIRNLEGRLGLRLHPHNTQRLAHRGRPSPAAIMRAFAWASR
jgi:hypothetical protein